MYFLNLWAVLEGRFVTSFGFGGRAFNQQICQWYHKYPNITFLIRREIEISCDDCIFFTWRSNKITQAINMTPLDLKLTPPQEVNVGCKVKQDKDMELTRDVFIQGLSQVWNSSNLFLRGFTRQTFMNWKPCWEVRIIKNWTGWQPIRALALLGFWTTK